MGALHERARFHGDGLLLVNGNSRGQVVEPDVVAGAPQYPRMLWVTEETARRCVSRKEVCLSTGPTWSIVVSWVSIVQRFGCDLFPLVERFLIDAEHRLHGTVCVSGAVFRCCHANTWCTRRGMARSRIPRMLESNAPSFKEMKQSAVRRRPAGANPALASRVREVAPTASQ